jgi:hypothetical protein
MERYGKVKFEDCDEPGIIRFRSSESEEDFVANMSDDNLRTRHGVLSYEILEGPAGWAPDFPHYENG